MQSCEFCLLIHIWQKERRVQPVKKRISLPMYGAEKDTELTSRGSVASERGEAPHAGETGAFSMVSLTGGSAKTKKHQLDSFCTLPQSSYQECTFE